MHGTGRGSRTAAGRGGLWALALFAAAVVIAACAAPGAASNPPATPGVATDPPATTAAATTPPASTAAGPTLQVRTDAEYGAVVTGAGGISLYVFTNDKGDGKSACTGDCAGSWPPLTVASAGALTPGTGVTGTLGTITRDDGSFQVTLGGSPLYYFAGDAAAGETKGQGLVNKWYLASPSGTAVTEDAGGESPGASSCSGPTCY